MTEGKSQWGLRMRVTYVPEDVALGTCHWANGEWQFLLVLLQDGLGSEAETDLNEESK